MLLPEWREWNPERTHGLPAWPVSAGYGSAADARLLLPVFGAPSRPGFLAAGIVAFGVGAVWGCILAACFTVASISTFLGFRVLIYKRGIIILMFWVGVGLGMRYLKGQAQRRNINVAITVLATGVGSSPSPFQHLPNACGLGTRLGHRLVSLFCQLTGRLDLGLWPDSPPFFSSTARIPE